MLKGRFLLMITLLTVEVWHLTKCQPGEEDQILERQYNYKTILDRNNRVRLEWNIFQQGDINYASFKLTVLAKKLPLIFGFGMSDHGEFTDADLIAFEIESDGTFEYIDCHTNSFGALVADKKNNYDVTIMQNNLADGDIELNLYLTRKLDTCDSEDYVIETGTVHLLHFIYQTKESLTDIIKNGFRPGVDADEAEMKQTQLVKSSLEEDNLKEFKSANYRYFEVLNEKVKLPTQDTVYWCKVFQLPKEFKQKHHIVGYEGVISENSKGIVHHMELFHCVFDPRKEMTTFNGQCKSEDKPSGLTQCRRVVAAWAMGASMFIYPKDVGGVIGGENYSSYMVLEVHYDNPHLRENVIDSSGLRIYYIGGKEEKLRKYDAGIMEIGLEYNSKNSIPPGMSQFHLHGFCLGQCTLAGFPPNGITVFASQLHTHLTGRRAWTSVVRDGRVISILNSDNHYDQMFQEIRTLHRPVRLLPGDGLVHTCVYDTTSRQSMTFGGYSIRDEMCVNYMHYYPAIKIEVCKSSISDKVLNDFFEKMRQYDFANTSSLASREDNFNSVRWSKITSSILSKLYDKAQISFSCNTSDGEHLTQVYRKSNSRTVLTGKERKYFDPIVAEGLATEFAPPYEEYQNQCDYEPSSRRSTDNTADEQDDD